LIDCPNGPRPSTTAKGFCQESGDGIALFSNPYSSDRADSAGDWIALFSDP
jgi:hypothetical protein